MESLYVFKFGGSCLKNIEALKNSVNIINHFKEKGKIIIVTSAFYGVTDRLIEWMEFSKNDRTKEESIAKLYEIREYHDNIVRKIISIQDLRDQCFEFIHKCFEELEEKIPLFLNKEDSLKERDFVLSYGERLSTFIFSKYLCNLNFSAEFISADDNLIITDENYGNALPILEKIEDIIPKRLKNLIDNNKIVVISGYYSRSENGNITTLGRGGSDFTATIISYALHGLYETTVIFWKDVKGLLSAPPKYESHAKLVTNISFKEAKELAFFGSKILHPLCLNLAEKKNVKVEIRCFEKPFVEEFTSISTEKIEKESVIKAITALENIAMVTVEGESMVNLPGVAAKLFSLMAENNININFISQSSSENNITFGVDEEDGFKAGYILAMSDYFGSRWVKVKVDHEVSLVAVVGEGMQHRKGIAGKVFTTLGMADVNVIAIAQGSSELNITFVIKRNDLKKAIQALYHTFIISNGKLIHD
ncbi:MAG: aspartate kinase [Promethearchaeota archaeon]